MIKLPVKYTFYFKKNRQFLLGLIIIVLQLAINLSISSEPKSKRLRYQKNLKRVEEFKKNMSEPEKAYYLPRRRFIDKQSVKPSDDRFYQIDIILRGTALREKNKWNIREIRKLEKFLESADDFELHRYFGLNEEIYLGMRAKKAIQSIKRDAKLDENWRKKNDPIFEYYLTH
ncbi:MAG TPA: hypothetical protein PLS71_02175, partial [Leptospiraceae bacterium]|nr:hypothetical protein [Leptospiraceae bacterium]